MKRISPARLVRRGWMVVVAVVVVAVAAFGVYRLHGNSGPHHPTSAANGTSKDVVAFDVKHITLEVFGDPGTVATVNYLDVNFAPQQVLNATLPWSLTMETTQPAAIANLVAQGDSTTLGCRITVDHEIKDERIVNEVNAYTFCLVKSA